MTKSINYKIKDMQEWLKTIKLNRRTSLYEVEINVCDVCNKSCPFCPRGNGYKPPHLNKYISVRTIAEICKQLTKSYKGYISLSGFGEPTLHPQIVEIIHIIQKLCPKCHIFITTNGTNLDVIKDVEDIMIEISHIDLLRPEVLESLHSPYRVNEIYTDKIKGFNNRAGNVRDYLKEPLKQCCNLPFYKMFIDINGNVLLCASDWKRKNVIGNIYEETIYDIWNNGRYKNVRLNLLNNIRTIICSKCDCNGLKNGTELVEYWKKKYGCKRKS